MTLKKQFEQALREAEGGLDFPEDQLERRLAARITELNWRLNVTVIVALSGWILAVIALWRTL